jgi:hypothetical protein
MLSPNLVLFLLCNQILLGFCLAYLMFLFLFFLFHDLNVELGLHLIKFWLENHVVLVVFMLVT